MLAAISCHVLPDHPCGAAQVLVPGRTCRSVRRVLTQVVEPLQVPLWIDLAAVVVGALAGAGAAVRERFDMIGVLLLAVVMGLGGGIVRDVLLGLRPVAVTDEAYLPTVVGAAVVGLVFASLLDRFSPVFRVLDALALGLFTLVGVEKALLYDVPYASAVFIGICAAVGGGILVDVLSGRPVEVVRQGPWNATAALAGGCLYVVVAAAGAPSRASETACFALVVLMRLSALGWGLGNPAPPPIAERRRGPE